MRWIAALSMRWILDPPPPTIPAQHTHTHSTIVLNPKNSLLASHTQNLRFMEEFTLFLHSSQDKQQFPNNQATASCCRSSQQKQKKPTHTHTWYKQLKTWLSHEKLMKLFYNFFVSKAVGFGSNPKLAYIMRNSWNFLMIFVSSSWRKKAEEEEEEAKPLCVCVCVCVCVWFRQISPNFDLKNTISTHTEDLSCKKI